MHPLLRLATSNQAPHLLAVALCRSPQVAIKRLVRDRVCETGTSDPFQIMAFAFSSSTCPHPNRHFVISTVVQHSPRELFANTAPLLEEKWHGGCPTLLMYRIDPFQGASPLRVVPIRLPRSPSECLPNSGCGVDPVAARLIKNELVLVLCGDGRYVK